MKSPIRRFVTFVICLAAAIAPLTVATPVHAVTNALNGTYMVMSDGLGNNWAPPGGVYLPDKAAGTPTHVTINGTSYDSAYTVHPIQDVVVTEQNVDTLLWLQSNGTWTSSVYRFIIAVGTCNVQTLNGVATQVCPWQLSSVYGPGYNANFEIRAHVRDNALNIEDPDQSYFFSEDSTSHTGQTLASSQTVSFGRTQLQQYTDTCATTIGSGTNNEIPLLTVASDLNTSYSYVKPVADVVVGRTLTAPNHECAGKIQYANYADLTTLKGYGWKFNSEGAVYAGAPTGTTPCLTPPGTGPEVCNLVWQAKNVSNLSTVVLKDSSDTALSVTGMDNEMCGSANTLNTAGYPGAAGQFNYPDNQVAGSGTNPAPSPADLLQSSYANGSSSCTYGFGRRYGNAGMIKGMQVPSGPSNALVNNNSPATALWYDRIVSVGGGICWNGQGQTAGNPNGSGVACSGGSGTITYANVDQLRQLFTTAGYGYSGATTSFGGGAYTNLQFYRLVQGSYSSTSASWDCTGASAAGGWKKHWTSNTELFCYNDFNYIVTYDEHVQPAQNSGYGYYASVTDPKTVANAWGHTVTP
jgi:hypothetical protein